LSLLVGLEFFILVGWVFRRMTIFVDNLDELGLVRRMTIFVDNLDELGLVRLQFFVLVVTM